MATAKRYDLSGKQLDEVTFKDDLLIVEANAQLVKDYIVAIRENARQWSANTKGRKEVRCSGKKPFKQKGTGRARQGYLAAPQFRGGGVVFGPKPKFDQHVKVNKKARKKVINYFISEKIKNNHFHVLKTEELKEPKTKKMVLFFDKLKIEGKRILVLLDNSVAYANFIKSIANIPKVEYALLSNLNGYNLALAEETVVMDQIVDPIIDMLKKEV